MNTIKVTIEFADNNLSAYVEGIDGVVAVGANAAEVKKNITEALKIYKDTCKEYDLDLPEVLAEDYEVLFKYDLATFLNTYGKVLSKAGLETLTGINQKQLWHYASGKSKPRKATVNRVAESIHAFANELTQIQFA